MITSKPKNLFIELTGVVLLMVVFAMTGCATHEQESQTNQEPNWKSSLDKKLPLLGHRNWILVVDKAFPIQNGDGIEVLYTGEKENKLRSKIQDLK